MSNNKKPKTFQLLPERAFFNLCDMYGVGYQYKRIVTPLPYPVRIEPAVIDGVPLSFLLHKDHYISKLFVLGHGSAFSNEKESYGPLHHLTVFKVFGGKISGFGNNEFYKNILYVDANYKVTPSFKPSSAISKIQDEVGELEKRWQHSGQIELQLSALEKIELIQLHLPKVEQPFY